MKIALCLSGHVRTYFTTINSLRELVKSLPVEPDVFFHVWNQMGTEFDGHLGAMPVNINDLVDATSRFAVVKDYVVEEKRQFSDFCPEFRKHKQGNSGIISMFYKIMACHELALKNGPYDAIIRARPDLVYSNVPSHEEFVDMAVHAPEVTEDWIGDLFACGPAAPMTAYSMTYTSLPELFEKHAKIPAAIRPGGAGLYPEMIFKTSLDTLGIPVKKSRAKAGILRDDGKIDRHFPEEQFTVLGGLS